MITPPNINYSFSSLMLLNFLSDAYILRELKMPYSPLLVQYNIWNNKSL